MSFGDHLEELRSRLIRALLGVCLGTVLSLVFAKHVLALLYRPLLVVLDAHGLQPSLMAIAVADPFMSYLKMAVITGLIVSMPWVLYQVWMFVSAGLYHHEQRFVRLFGPVSLLLFAAGVAFMYAIVLPVVLNFFVRFNQSFGMPELERSGFMKVLLGSEATSQPAEPAVALPVFPVLREDPAEPAPGSVWINSTRRRLCVQTAEEVLVVPLERLGAAAAVSSQFALQFYVTFVLMLALAFGIAFELPIAVLFLAVTRLVSARTMAKARRYVIFGIFVVGAMLTPPDVISQVLLAIPMIALFEGGLLAARIVERRREQQDAAANAQAS